MLSLDIVISPFDKLIALMPFILIGALIAAAIAVSVVLIAKLAKKKKNKK